MTARSIAHAKQIKPAGATAKLAQNSALSARREKGICILRCNSGSRPCELGAKQTIFQDEPGGRLQSRLRGSLEAIEIATKQKMYFEASLDGWNWSKCTWMSIFLNRFHLHWKGRCNFTLYMGQCSFLLTVLAFRCPLSVYSQIAFVSAKNTLSRRQPTNQIQEVCQRHLSKTNSHLHHHADRSQEIQQPQTNANKTFSSQRL